MQRIRKGDLVRIISGDETTKEGIVLQVLPKKQSAIVEGLNIVKMHQKPDQKNRNKGGIISKEAPIKLSKLAIVSAKAPQGISKIAYRMDKNNKKIRIAKKTNTEVVVGKKK